MILTFLPIRESGSFAMQTCQGPGAVPVPGTKACPALWPQTLRPRAAVLSPLPSPKEPSRAGQAHLQDGAELWHLLQFPGVPGWPGLGEGQRPKRPTWPCRPVLGWDSRRQSPESGQGGLPGGGTPTLVLGHEWGPGSISGPAL